MLGQRGQVERLIGDPDMNLPGPALAPAHGRDQGHLVARVQPVLAAHVLAVDRGDQVHARYGLAEPFVLATVAVSASSSSSRSRLAASRSMANRRTVTTTEPMLPPVDQLDDHPVARGHRPLLSGQEG